MKTLVYLIGRYRKAIYSGALALLAAIAKARTDHHISEQEIYMIISFTLAAAAGTALIGNTKPRPKRKRRL